VTHHLNNIQEFLDHGITLLKSGKFDEAEAVFLVAQTKWPDSPLPYTGSARTAHFSNNYSLALERWIIAHEKFPADIQILRGLGNIYLELKKLDKANKCFIEVLDLEANYFKEMHEFMQGVNLLIDSKEYTKAKELLLEAEIRWPENIVPFHAHHRLLETIRRNSR
jgi:tetratricopeptide (TPR) repeat protein